MCLGVPGKVLEVSGTLATVDFWGVRRTVRLDIVDPPLPWSRLTQRLFIRSAATLILVSPYNYIVITEPQELVLRPCPGWSGAASFRLSAPGLLLRYDDLLQKGVRLR